jgi:bifunctional NMN adenylyltransferase/nudix hydrolase
MLWYGPPVRGSTLKKYVANAQECPRFGRLEVLIASKIAGNTVATIPIATEEEDRKWTEDFKTSWAGTPYPPIFVTADAVMIRDQQVLLVRRGRLPGRGRLALPGGYVDQDELIRDAAIRELIEETNPSDGSQLYSPKMLYDWITAWQVFDDPRRSARGRVITTAFVFEVPKDAPEISFTAGDDAGEAAWHDLNNLNAAEFFEDHFHIIRELLL